jgi:hypothetical protein
MAGMAIASRLNRRAALAALLPGLLLAACSNAPTNARLPIACPTPGLLAEGADLTRYRPDGPRDLANVDWDARLTGLSGGCSRGRNGQSIDMRIIAGFEVQRGPGAVTRQIDLPWFVAVIEGGTDRVMSRQSFRERVTFSRNETRINGQSDPVTINLPVGENRRAQDYRILVSFELLPEDLDLNRRRGPR